MKKSILFVINGYHIGGVNKAFLTFARHIDFSNYDVSLFPTKDSDIWRANLPEEICVLQREGMGTTVHANWTLRKIIYRMLVHMSKSSVEADHWAVKTWNFPERVFDYVICYNGQDIAAITAACGFRAKKHLIWFHGEVSSLDKNLIKLSKKMIGKFSAAVSVSQALCSDILSVYPQMKDKIYIVHNTVDAKRIVQLSQIQPPDLLKENAIVTVGRLCYEKGQDMIPGAAKLLLDAGYEVFWYLVGDGEARDKITSEIDRYDVNGNVILLGTKDNPFPYMRRCGIYVQPSRSEGWGLTVQECKVIGKTAIVTRIPAFIEQIIDGETGIVADDVSIESIYRAVKFALDNPQEVSRIETNLRKNDYDSKAEIERFYHVLEEGCVE